jgi:hypothetical protein
MKPNDDNPKLLSEPSNFSVKIISGAVRRHSKIEMIIKHTAKRFFTTNSAEA